MNELRQRLDQIHRHNQVVSDYQKTLALLRALKAGEVALDQVAMLDDGWNLVDMRLDLTPQEPAPLIPVELNGRNLEPVKEGA